MESTSRLCDLITGHLLPYLEPKPTRLTNETEKDLLFSLTRVRREIQRWTTESSSKSEEMGGGPYISHCFHQSLHNTVGEHSCLCNIISSTVAFLNADSQFVRHAAGNILLSFSQLLIRFECLWTKFLRLIWFILEAALPTIYSCPELSASAVIHVDERLMHHEPTLADITEVQNLHFANVIALLKSRLLNVNQFMFVHLFQTLRNILKSLKHESDYLEEVFIQYAVSSLIKMPWDLLIEVFDNCCYTSQMSFQHVDELDIRSSVTGMKNLLLGTVLQLCCSLVKVYDLEADDTGPLKVLSVYTKFSDLVPKLLSCCFIDHLGNSRKFLFGYLRHKSLIMMTRLSFNSHWKNSRHESWLKLLGQFFGEILHQSISECDAGSENCLDESPFFSSTLEGDKSYARHLQRQAIFLLFKCSFTIASVGEASKYACKEETTSSSFGLQLCRKQCHLGLLETFAWLQRCFPLDKFQDCKSYSESCSSFATSFLQLYMEEDDMLFKMLLQLLDAPFSAWQNENSNINGFVGANKDMLCHFSNIFCPIRLFHLFLLLLHYDHLVLVDYLMSKDTGIHCLQYLLRCLRVIYKSWPAFMEFSIFDNESGRLYHKRRRVSQDEESSYEISDSQTFENAKRCFHSLKLTLGELQRKSLFPYNSKPLLKSLARFQELCMTYNSHQT